MVRFSTVILFMACLSVVMYFLDPTSTVAGYVTSKGTAELDANTIVSIAIMGGITLAISLFILVISGFAAVYIIAAEILIAVLAYFIFPFGFLINPNLSPFLSYPLMFIFNVILVLAVVDFVRGGG
jgi:hypothetical protein